MPAPGGFLRDSVVVLGSDDPAVANFSFGMDLAGSAGSRLRALLSAAGLQPTLWFNSHGCYVRAPAARRINPSPPACLCTCLN